MKARHASRRRFSLAGKLALCLGLFSTAATVLSLALDRLFDNAWLAGILALLVLVPLALWFARRALAPALSMFRALSGTVTSYRDGDYSFGLAWKRNDELGDLVAAHNALGDALREQRVALVQRELLLDTMVQNTPVAMLLADNAGRIVYSNLASRKLLNNGRRLEGEALDTHLHGAPEPLREAIERGGDGLFAVGHDDDEQIFHLARRGFRLNGRRHELFLLRHLTAELRRQEVQTWKKVIRIISHELNNSLAPIASLAHSGAELVRREQYQRLAEIFGTIEERARHLEGFIRDYARFAKLPAPRLEPIVWAAFCDRLNSQIGFTLDGSLPEKAARLDAAQLEQALLNLLKNAHESGSPPEHVSLRVRRFADALRIDVSDRGSGMNEAVLANALVPFYSTKRSGTGLGLALAREIAEAHGGRIALSNRDGGGLSVTLVIPE